MDTETMTASAAPSRHRANLDGSAAPRLTPRVSSLLVRIRGEYLEMPGLTLTEVQARRLWDLDRHTCRIALAALLDLRFLERTARGAYVRAGGPRASGPSGTSGPGGALQNETTPSTLKGRQPAE